MRLLRIRLHKKPQQIILQNSGQLHLPVYSAIRGWKKFVTVPI